MEEAEKNEDQLMEEVMQDVATESDEESLVEESSKFNHWVNNQITFKFRLLYEISIFMATV